MKNKQMLDAERQCRVCREWILGNEPCSKHETRLYGKIALQTDIEEQLHRLQVDTLRLGAQVHHYQQFVQELLADRESALSESLMRQAKELVQTALRS